MRSWQTILSIAFAVVFSQAAPGSATRGYAQSIEELTDSDLQQFAQEEEGQTVEKIDIAAVRRAIVEQTNEFRSEQGLSTVESNESLHQAADKFAEFMAESRKYGHHADGHTPAERAEAAGYEYCIVLENIAYRQQTRGLASVDLASHFVEGWKNSPEHRKNMLDPAVSETGVGLALGENGNTIFAVQKFGRPESARLRIDVTNETAEPVQLVVEGKSNSREFSLPPRSTLTLERCRPTGLSLAEGEADQQVEKSSDWVVRTEDNQPVLRPAGS